MGVVPASTRGSCCNEWLFVGTTRRMILLVDPSFHYFCLRRFGRRRWGHADLPFVDGLIYYWILFYSCIECAVLRVHIKFASLAHKSSFYDHTMD